MSKRIASVITGFANLATLPLNRRQKMKALATVTQDLERSGAVEVQTAHGPLKFYALRGAGTASSVERFGKDEPETIEWIDTYLKPSQTLWDIGANIGLYSLYAGLRPDVKVISFEPSALNFALLTEHIALNKLDKRISPLCIALGPETKLESLNMRTFEVGGSSNAIGQAATHFKTFTPIFTQSIPAFSGDDFIKIFNLQTPDHIKLDVDGIEDRILKGLVNTLPQVRTIMMEVEDRDAASVADTIEKPLFAAGFIEEASVRQKGHGRNRLYINKQRTA